MISKPEKHIFVCTSSRLTGENKGYCVEKDGIEMIQAFAEEIQERELDGEVMVSNTGCFGLCSKGPIVMIYPEQTWYGNVTIDDVEEILDALEEGTQIERLLI